MDLASETRIDHSYDSPLVVTTAVGRFPRTEVDIGCGDGDLLVRLAAQHPRTHFIGVELAWGHAQRAASRAVTRGLQNVTVVNGEAAAYIDSLPGQSVGALHIYFPTPFPVSIGLSTRLFDERFAWCAYRVLQAGGILRLLTDHGEYHRDVVRALYLSRVPWRATEWLPVAAGQASAQFVGTPWEHRVVARRGRIWSHCVLR
jgi:tRNA G46 methylase TrmB